MTRFILWGLTASPYQLKMQSLLDFAGHDWQRWPQQAGRWSALRMFLRLGRAKRRGQVRRFGGMSDEMDEYPAVPFYSEDEHSFNYDSSSLARYLDQHPQRHDRPLVPANPRLAFICHLIDEAFDEFGLYMVHHNRWVNSARTTPMGDMTAREFASLLPPGLAPVLARRLYRRQSQRCPYLFSVAPEGLDVGVASERTPPSRPGFPATHELLDTAWREYLAAMEHLLERQPYLLGERFTLADASAYGQLGMNLVDGETTDRMRELAPRTYRWLCAIADGEHGDSSGKLTLSPALLPLLDVIGRTFMPLMAQNEQAYEKACAGGETLFNEAGFEQGRGLYDGQLCGHPFRAGVKTFQVAVWRALREQWQALEATDRDCLQREFLPDVQLIAGGSR